MKNARKAASARIFKEFPGAISQGETAIEAAENVFDALVQLLAAQAEEQLKTLDSAPHEVELALS